jgi:hypothetical protein
MKEYGPGEEEDEEEDEEEVTRHWRKLNDEELCDLYSSSNVIPEMKSRMRWAGHVARMGRKEVLTRFGEGVSENFTTWKIQA